MKIFETPITYYHWCPGCKKLHPLPKNGWTFNGNHNRPSFQPSFFQEKRSETEACHYVLTDGVINFAGGSRAHTLDGQAIPMPDIPEEDVARLREFIS